jgi:hypothetical protein
MRNLKYSHYILLCVFLSLTSCYNCKDYKEIEFKGKISNIYSTSMNHHQYTFQIQLPNGYLDFVGQDFPRSWEYAGIGDSIIKLKDSLKIEIKKPTDESKFFYCK